jgi:protein-S-isoprenylcysteine O-methyltransferase Ste14
MRVDIATRPNRIPWPPVLLALAIGGALALGWLAPLPWPGLDDLPARIIGYGFGLAGAALIGWALVVFAHYRANVWPTRAATTLLTSGPFRLWRNPIYMGEILLLLGAAQALHNLWFVPAAAVFAIAVLKLAIIPEEAHLEARFGDDYLRYKAQSRRWF